MGGWAAKVFFYQTLMQITQVISAQSLALFDLLVSDLFEFSELSLAIYGTLEVFHVLVQQIHAHFGFDILSQQLFDHQIFIYSASLTSLPKDIYEAADLDGVNAFQKFFYITLPQLKPTTFFLTITGIISSFKVFGQVNVMTQGGPGSSTYTLVYYIYKSAFTYYNMGYASSVAVILFLMLLTVTLIQWKHNKEN